MKTEHLSTHSPATGDLPNFALALSCCRGSPLVTSVIGLAEKTHFSHQRQHNQRVPPADCSPDTLGPIRRLVLQLCGLTVAFPHVSQNSLLNSHRQGYDVDGEATNNPTKALFPTLASATPPAKFLTRGAPPARRLRHGETVGPHNCVSNVRPATVPVHEGILHLATSVMQN